MKTLQYTLVSLNLVTKVHSTLRAGYEQSHLVLTWLYEIRIAFITMAVAIFINNDIKGGGAPRTWSPRWGVTE